MNFLSTYYHHRRKCRSLLTAVVACATCLAALPVPAQSDTLAASVIRGQILFRKNCSACHSIHTEKTGPMLASIPKKRTKEWLVNFIQNSAKVIAQHDEYAKKLAENFHGQIMPPFQKLTKQNITDILNYIEKESQNPTQADYEDNEVLQQKNDEILKGRKLFKDQCQTCHLVHAEAYGPALGSVSKRHDQQWLIAFIKNSSKVIQAGDPYANTLYNQFDKKTMVKMEFLTDEEIKSILRYIEFVSTLKTTTADPEK